MSGKCFTFITHHNIAEYSIVCNLKHSMPVHSLYTIINPSITFVEPLSSTPKLHLQNLPSKHKWDVHSHEKKPFYFILPSLILFMAISSSTFSVCGGNRS